MFHRNQEGASALEFALVLPILILLIFGAFSVALGFNLKLSISHAARDGARYAATLDLPDEDDDDVIDDSWFEEVRDRAVATSSGGLLANGGDSTVICVAYVVGDLFSGASGPDTTGLGAASRALTFTAHPSGSGWQSSATQYCYVDELQPTNAGERVQVLVSRPFDFNLVLFTNREITVTSNSIARYEDPLVPQPSESASASP